MSIAMKPFRYDCLSVKWFFDKESHFGAEVRMWDLSIGHGYNETIQVGHGIGKLAIEGLRTNISGRMTPRASLKLSQITAN